MTKINLRFPRFLKNRMCDTSLNVLMPPTLFLKLTECLTVRPASILKVPGRKRRDTFLPCSLRLPTGWRTIWSTGGESAGYIRTSYQPLRRGSARTHNVRPWLVWETYCCWICRYSPQRGRFYSRHHFDKRWVTGRRVSVSFKAPTECFFFIYFLCVHAILTLWKGAGKSCKWC